jgi:Tfp pilus assembly protein PilO
MERVNGLTAVVISSVLVVLVVLVGWFMLISPQRSKAATLESQKASVDTQVAADQAMLAAPRRKRTEASIHAAERALPDSPQISEVLRQLSSLAAQSRTELDGVSPGTPVPSATASVIPISLTFKGRYFGLQKLLRLLRQSAKVQGGKVVSTGRLYTVDSIAFEGGQAAGGDVAATIALNAYMYTGTANPTGTPAATVTTTTATAAAPTQ